MHDHFDITENHQAFVYNFETIMEELSTWPPNSEIDEKSSVKRVIDMFK